MELKELKTIVKNAAAIRYRARLQPAGGPGDKVFPPTYEGGQYAKEERMIDDQLLSCVHLDSVQSQANRMEEALLEAARSGQISLPLVEVDFRAKAEELQKQVKDKNSEEWNELEDLKLVGAISSLDAPHRLADAILRDSRSADGVRFRETPEGDLLNTASLKNATGLFEISPTSLLFGLWDSTGPKGGLGVKFQRAIVSEVVAVGAIAGAKSASRLDPLGIVRDAGTIYQLDAASGDWTLDPQNSAGKKLQKKGKEGKPSEVNHGNVTPSVDTVAGGVTFSYATQSTVISLPALRRLCFPVGNKNMQETSLLAQSALAALGLTAAVLLNAKGISFRSRCDLVLEAPGVWEVVNGDGTTKSFSLTPDEACQLLNNAVKDAETAGLKWRREPVVLLPSDGLAQLVRNSRRLTAQAKGEG